MPLGTVGSIGSTQEAGTPEPRQDKPANPSLFHPPPSPTPKRRMEATLYPISVHVMCTQQPGARAQTMTFRENAAVVFCSGSFWNLWYQIWGTANKSEISRDMGTTTQWGQHVYDTCPTQHDTGTGTGTGAPLPCGSVGPPFGATDTLCVHARPKTAGRHCGSTRRVRVPLVLPANFSGGM